MKKQRYLDLAKLRYAYILETKMNHIQTLFINFFNLMIV